jgi:hypothetical protein
LSKLQGNRVGSGAAKVSSPGEDTPQAPRAFADPLASSSVTA